MKEENEIKGVKGYNKDLKCRDFQYKIGKTYETDQKPVRCTENGFHFCTNPFDVFVYYPPATSKYGEVIGCGEVSTDKDDTKVAVSKIHIGAEISLHDLIIRGIKLIFEKTTLTKEKTNTKIGLQASNSGDNGAASNSGERGAASNSGNRGAASNSGDRGAASNSGYSGAASNSGDRGAASNSGNNGAASNSGDNGAAFSIGFDSIAETTGEESIACAVGISNRAKGTVGCWLVLSEYKEDKSGNLHLKSVKSILVDNKRIKANTFYSLRNGKFIKSK
jgi:hypothetical protein